MSSYKRTGPASRALALDLVLRTFMNSADFNVSNRGIWDNISRLVPGTTPLQCAQRWEELLLSSNSVIAGDLSGLTATGRPISASGSRPKKLLKRTDPSTPASDLSETKISTGAVLEITRPHSVMLGRSDRPREDGVWRSASSEDKLWNHINQQVQEEQGKRNLERQEKSRSRGAFAANFCQSFLKRSKDDMQQSVSVTSNDTRTSSRIETKRGKLEEGWNSVKTSSSSSSAMTQDSTSTVTSSSSPNMIIHVSDDTKKIEKDFVCSRDILVREMQYFAEHLSSEAPQPWDEVDISVHCDIPVFEWLMRYAKRGLYSGPCGEVLTEPLAAPELEVDNIVSILISSDFLRMEKLVEECLIYCSHHLSAVLASPCNMGCINDKLVAWLAAKLTPLELEETVDRKDKLKSKLFLYHLEELFKPVSLQSSASAATLYRCKHCKRLLTSEQENLLPCSSQRLSISGSGKMVYSHEVCPSWNVNSYIQSLQLADGLTPRDLYWRIWSLVNLLQCEECHSSFQCCDLMQCPYHPEGTICSSKNGTTYLCCSQRATKFSLIRSAQSGCCSRAHSVSNNSSELSKQVYSTLLQLPDSIYTTLDPSNSSKDRKKPDSSLKQSIQRELEAGLSESPKVNTTLLSLLQTEHTKPRYSSAPTQESNTSSNGSSEASADTMAISCSTSSTATSSARQQSRDAVASASDMEEDDDEDDEEPVIASSQQYMMGRNKRKASQRQRHSRHDTKGSGQAKDWVWNPKKSRRWNQDMQRESDERRQNQLVTQLSRMNTTANKVKEVTYAGGIFSRLEAQFRAQQAAKAMAIQTTQSRSHGSNRKRF